MRALGRIALVVAVAALAACGLPEDDRPRLVTADMIPLDLNPGDSDAQEGGTQSAFLYLVDASGKLTTVERPVRATTVEESIEALLLGPTPAETAERLSTSIPPDTDLVSAVVDDDIVTIDLTGEEGGINSIQGSAQLTAYAQIVLTAVAVEGVDRVRFLIDGEAVDVPNDGPPTREPVGAVNYRSLELPPLPTTSTTRPTPSNDFVD